MNLKLIENSEEYYEFIRVLRTHQDNIQGFFEQVEITPEQQKKYMGKYCDKYYIAIENEEPVGFVGQVDDDIRVCVHPDHKGKGVGKFMINELMIIHPQAHAKVFVDNIASKNLFLSCGFVCYKTDEKFIYFKK